MSERTPQCILGNGECPTDCRLIKYSVDITNGLGDKFDPQVSRTMVLFADGLDDSISLKLIAMVKKECMKENVSTTIFTSKELI